jgi:cytochrome P450 RapN
MPYGGEAWLVTRYDDVRRVLTDRRFSRSATFGRDVPRLVPFVQHMSNILTMDPPEHTRHRRLVGSAFTARRISELEPDIQRFVDDLLDDIEKSGPPADVVPLFTRPLPVLVTCKLLGVPFEDHRLFYGWAAAMRSSDGSALTQMREVGKLPWDYMAERIAVEREFPSQSLLGDLVRARDHGDRLSEDELVSFAVTLLLAGQETTTDELGNLMVAVLRQPELLDRLRSDPEELTPAIEELLRYSPIGTLSGFTRIATDDVELSGGVVRAGEAVVAQADAANHDPDVFDEPDEICFDRASKDRHLAFGMGPHHCLGAGLARVELRIAMRSIICRFPRLALAAGERAVSWKGRRSSIGPKALLVSWR